MDSTSIWLEINQSLLKFIRSKVRDEQTAGDILHEVYLKMQDKLPQLRNREKMVPWVYQIARNTINDHYRMRKREMTINTIDYNDTAESAPTDDLTAGFALFIPSAIDALPEKYREALRLVEIEGLSQKELAERLQISYSGAKSRVQRGREKLREAILECCHVYTDSYGNVMDVKPNTCAGDC